ncbi:MAG: isochorismatase family protein [Methyloprofundus sp.]|nr:isochorismatase family protein [Methyloprofundus sp.]
MYKLGSLFDEVQICITNGVKIALLIIDEDPMAAIGEQRNVTPNQQRLLSYMQINNCLICSINFPEYYPERCPNYDSTRPALKLLYNGHEYHLQKPHYNAFRETSLHPDLQELNITHLVIMGFDINYCIRATIGVSDNSIGKNVGLGATQLGYKVMTCDQVLHGGCATWSASTPSHYSNLVFYSHFESDYYIRMLVESTFSHYNSRIRAMLNIW